MSKLSLVASTQTVRAQTNTTHRASATEGEAIRRLLEAQGFPCKRTANGQMEFSCPFHQGPGEAGRKAVFYVHAQTSVYFCQSASCGERGNLHTMERFFGVYSEDADSYVSAYRDRESRLVNFEKALTTVLRRPFYDHGLTDTTIERFRLGYDIAEDRLVIPYLEGRRPRVFRYYSPDVGKPNYDERWKYVWEEGATASLFNAQDSLGDAEGRTYICEGELKAMLLVQLGYAATAVPGATQWKPEWQAAFTHARQVFVVYDNDNPDFHDYDKPDHPCRRCAGAGHERCTGHNPGQDAALNRVIQIGWRARNVVLPLPSRDVAKTDINDYFMRDGASNADFAELVTGRRVTPFKVSSLADISAAPPEEATFLVEQGILPRGGRLLIAGKPKVGKMAAVSTPVLTPHGWTTMGAITPGDEVIGSDGHGVRVTHVHPQGVKALYRVRIDDGSSTLAGAEHLWTVRTSKDRAYTKRDGRPRWQTMTTARVAELLAQGRTRDTYLPIVAPVHYAPTPEPVLDAYGLGLLLGKGAITTSSPSFTEPKAQLHEALRTSFPDQQHTASTVTPGTCYLTPTGASNTLIQGLRALGLWGCRSEQKFVPECYLRGSVTTRIALLQGLLDTDGWVQDHTEHRTNAYFGTSSARLAAGVVELVESLGGTTWVQHKPARGVPDGGTERESWTIRVCLPAPFEPFRTGGKLAKWRSGRTSKTVVPSRRIVGVTYSHDEQAQCITVANPDGLYVTDRFLLTHNSIFVDNLALSLAAGIPFLRTFAVDHPTRTLLLDRELSKWSLFSRMQALSTDRPGYRAAAENLLIDHDHLMRLDQPNAYETLVQLVEQNGAEVVILDTAYKFFGGDVESSTSVMKGFAVLDKVIHETGVAVVMTHHHKKGQGGSGKANADIADPDNVAGSFLWTGWPNGTILLNYLDRSVANPFNAVATFTAFRDAAPPEPLALYRDRDSISYSAITPYSHDDASAAHPRPSDERPRPVAPSTAAVAELLLEACPTTEEVFLHQAAAWFGVSMPTLRPYLVDALAGGDFERTQGRPPVIQFRTGFSEQSWEAEHGLPERPLPAHAGAGLDELADPELFDAAALS